MSLPIRIFWLMSNQVVRIQADEDSRALRVAAAAQSTEGIKQANEMFGEEMGNVFVVSSEHIAKEAVKAAPEAGAFDKLRSLV